MPTTWQLTGSATLYGTLQTACLTARQGLYLPACEKTVVNNIYREQMATKPLIGLGYWALFNFFIEDFTDTTYILAILLHTKITLYDAYFSL